MIRKKLFLSCLSAAALTGLLLSVLFVQARATRANTVATSYVYLPFITNQTTAPGNVGSVLTPYGASDESPAVGPYSWSSNYGKTPEIIITSNGTELDVLAQDYDNATAWNAVLFHVSPTGNGGYEITQTLTDMPMLDRVMGLDVDGDGNRYYATAVDESGDVNSSYPPLNTYRTNIVRVIKLDPAGNTLYNIDVDTARHAFNNSAEMIINPMVAASARLEVGGGEIALVHGNNTDPDWNIEGRRHQKALSTRLNASNGAITRVSSGWVSHSFDQRLLYDGSSIIEHHLGDAYPRYLVFGRNHQNYPLFHIKGDLGANVTRTRLGNLALIENDATYGYLALFAAENTTGTTDRIEGARNLAIVRVNKSDNSVDPTMSDSLTVSSSGSSQTNHLKWLTSYSGGSNIHAERPKLIGIGNDQYIVLWEQWHTNETWTGDTFQGVYGMVIDDEGNTVQAAKLLTIEHHLHRGDDAVLLDGKAAWMSGNSAEKKLYLHLVDSSLNYQLITFD